MTKQTQDFTFASLRNLQEDIYSYCRDIQNALLKVYLNTDFMRDAASGMSENDLKRQYGALAFTMAINQFDPSQNVVALYIYAFSGPNSSSPVSLISLYRHAQTPVYTYPENIFRGDMPNNIDAVKKYINSDERIMFISSYYNEKRKTDIVRFVLKIYHNVNTEIGFIVCDVDGTVLNKMISKEFSVNDSLIWLQPDNDCPVVSSHTSLKNVQTSASAIMSAIASGSNDYTEKILPDCLLFKDVQKKYNLTAYCLVPMTALKTNQIMLNRNTALSLVLLIIVFSISFIVISKNLTAPLTYVVGIMGRIKNGERQLRLKTMQRDEIGILAEQFNDMLDRISMLIEKEYKAKFAADEAQYKALQAQVNPHFLYNTLDTMSSIASDQNCETVSMICLALSNMFRYSLDMSNQLSTVEEEIVHLKNYLYVINIRMQNSITTEILIGDYLLGERVPRLCLQPLVENSIQHGLKNKRGKKNIRVYAAIHEDSFQITVWDNGTGFDAFELNMKLQRTVDEVLTMKDSIGLMNIQSRIHMLFGSGYGIKIQSDSVSGTSVIMTLPCDCRRGKPETEAENE